jgi:hypothetical protein
MNFEDAQAVELQRHQREAEDLKIWGAVPEETRDAWIGHFMDEQTAIAECARAFRAGGGRLMHTQPSIAAPLRAFPWRP